MKLEDSMAGKVMLKFVQMIHPKPQPPGVTDVTVQGQETLLGKQKKKNGYQDTRLAVAGEAPATSWYKETLG
jgi:hypothetical protein